MEGQGVRTKITEMDIRAAGLAVITALNEKGVTVRQYQALMLTYFRGATADTIDGRDWSETFKVLRRHRMVIYMAGTNRMRLTDNGHTLLDEIHALGLRLYPSVRRIDPTDV